MNKTIIAIVIVAVVVLGGYFFFRGSYRTTSSVPQASNQQTVTRPSTSKFPSQQLPAGQTQDAGQNVVTYSNAGYSPNTITIKLGETITFKNNSSQSMRTASAIHPTHRGYPTSGGCIGSTFDACLNIQPGNSWSFRFDIAGTWKYHNHLNPSDTGTVIVKK